MSQIQQLDLENIGRNIRSKKMGVAKIADGKSRKCLQPLAENHAVPKSKRVKLDEPLQTVEESDQEQLPQQLKYVLNQTEQSNKVVLWKDNTEDLPDPLLYIAEYKQDIWDYLRELELTHPAPKPRYMRKQADLNWNARSIVVDWLASVADAYDMCNETLHLSVNYVDRFLSHYAVDKNKFQLVAACAMLMAGKMEEIYPIDVKEWSHLAAETFTPRQLLKMERLISKVLSFRMQPPTMVNFIQHFCHEHNLDKKTTCLAMYISELVLLEGAHYLNHKPSKLAAASIALARHTLAEKSPWPKKFKNYSGYNLKQLSPIVVRQQQSLIDSPHKEQQEIQTKYKREKYHSVALLQPRNLSLALLDEEEE